MTEKDIHINGIYEHYKNKHLYKVVEVAYHAGLSAPIVIYHRCNEHGVFQSIRDETDPKRERTIKQPFYRDLEEFLDNVQGGYPDNPAIPRFKYLKQPTS